VVVGQQVTDVLVRVVHQAVNEIRR
jgi:hypothetical protein